MRDVAQLFPPAKENCFLVLQKYKYPQNYEHVFFLGRRSSSSKAALGTWGGLELGRYQFRLMFLNALSGSACLRFVQGERSSRKTPKPPSQEHAEIPKLHP